MIQHVITPLNAGLTSAVTFFSGAVALIDETTPVTLGIFVACCAGIISVGIWLGKIAVTLTVRLEQGNARMERLEHRVDSLESTIRERGK